MALTFNLNRDPSKHAAVEPSHFNPFKVRKKKRRPDIENVPVIALKGLFGG